MSVGSSARWRSIAATAAPKTGVAWMADGSVGESSARVRSSRRVSSTWAL
jgi:hypothetical protein